MGLYNEEQIVPRWYTAHGVPEHMSRLAMAEDEVFFPIVAVGLERTDVIIWFAVDHGEGAAFVTPKGDVYISASAVISMMVRRLTEQPSEQDPQQIKDFEDTVNSIREDMMYDAMIEANKNSGDIL